MKKLLFLLIIAGLSFNFQCNRNKTFELNKSFELGYLEEAINSTTGLKVSFSSVSEDSRCPEGVTCVWEGRAMVELKVTGAKEMVVQLIEQAGKDELATITQDGMIFTLDRLLPYPKGEEQIQQEDYRVMLTISKP